MKYKYMAETADYTALSTDNRQLAVWCAHYNRTQLEGMDDFKPELTILDPMLDKGDEAVGFWAVFREERAVLVEVAKGYDAWYNIEKLTGLINEDGIMAVSVITAPLDRAQYDRDLTEADVRQRVREFLAGVKAFHEKVSTQEDRLVRGLLAYREAHRKNPPHPSRPDVHVILHNDRSY